ncbi:hypothetical protein KIN20_007524 [Parelaphostrongylus tenuis]|uniref:Uncharacterized protein n=1 Tax=Parelaphostrongylus tenuis TaxID=148309 RepID=A0AAD5QK32_PARTN|nr:hypothetical protein KIN20_007524 [Parelaphostrongylus tenuis]
MVRLFVIVSILLTGVACRIQSIAVKGRITCGKKPAACLSIGLWDEDVSGIFDFADSDDLLDRRHSGPNGEFYLAGSTDEISNIDPYLMIYHNCREESEGETSEVKFTLPDEYITYGSTPSRILDFGVINLEAIRQRRMLRR